MRPAPIAIFTFKRPEHTHRLLESLRTNPEFADSRVVAFSDGPRTERDRPLVEATRRILSQQANPKVEMIARKENVGLAANVVEGVTRLCNEEGRAIVLEDDLVVSPTFLSYMNLGLARYVDESSVFQVAGFMYPLDVPCDADALFLPFISSWGWATWKRAWSHFDPTASGYAVLASDRKLRRQFDLLGNYEFFRMLERQVNREIDSWAIRWYLTVFMKQGLALFPKRSLVQNDGFGEAATHCVDEAPAHVLGRANAFCVQSLPPVTLDPDVYRRVVTFMGRDRTISARIARALRRIARGKSAFSSRSTK